MVDTQTLQINPQNINYRSIKQAAKIILAGGLVAFPTETVYGLGANALDESAVNKIFAAKKRPANDPLIVHIESLSQLQQISLNPPQIVWRLADEFWAGPLTLILKKSAQVAANVSSMLDTVAVRMPNHPIALALLKQAGVPIAAPSANLFSRPSPTCATHVLEDLAGRIDLILDGGSTSIGVESTVLDLTGKTPTILRPGGILLEDLRKVLPTIQLNSTFLNTDNPQHSPGMLLKHYSPQAEVQLFTGTPAKIISEMQARCQAYADQKKSVGVLIVEEDVEYFQELPCQILTVGSESDLAEIARNLFAALRSLDKQAVEFILVRAFAPDGLGVALWDRLLRAAEGHVVDVDR